MKQQLVLFLRPGLPLGINVQLLLALGAESVDLNVVAGDQVTGLLAGLLVQLILYFREIGREDVGDFATVFTDDVVVGATEKVVTNPTVVVGQFDDDAQIH